MAQPEPTSVARESVALRLLTRHSLLVLLVALLILYSILDPSTFLTLDNFTTLLFQETVPVVVALAVLMPIIGGGFDLSVGYVVGFSSVMAAEVAGRGVGNSALVIVVALLTGLVAGAVNGVLVARLHINPFIATLGLGLAISGLSVGVTGGQNLFQGIPALVVSMSNDSVGGLKSAVWIAAVITVICYVVARHTPVGKRMYAIGGNERVAKLGGIHVSRIKIGLFVAAGLLAAVAGLFQLGQTGSASPSFGPELLLPAFAAVFLGQTTVRPGFFNVPGTILAILVLAVNFSGLSLLGAPLWVSPVIDGAALIIGVLLGSRLAPK